MDVKDKHGRTTSVTFIIHDFEWSSPNWTHGLKKAGDETLHNGGMRYAEDVLDRS
jgi:hypothetical protein